MNQLYDVKYTISEKLFIGFAKCLGVDIFKKLWPVKGYFSYNKLDKNKISDLEKVIDDSKMFTAQHITGATEFSIVGIVIGLTPQIEPVPKKGILTLLGMSGLLYHGYPFIVHHYNRILARKRIEYLKINNLDKEDKQKIIIENDKEKLIEANKEQIIQIQKNWSNTTYILRLYELQLEPYFLKLEDAISFRDYIIKRLYPKDNEDLKRKIMYMINMKEGSKYYLQWFHLQH